jgi:hypothetical protein
MKYRTTHHKSEATKLRTPDEIGELYGMSDNAIDALEKRLKDHFEASKEPIKIGNGTVVRPLTVLGPQVWS